MSHTPTPWRLTHPCAYGNGIYGDENQWIGYTLIITEGVAGAQANADFIVRAVNSHDALVDALQNILNGIDTGVITSDHDEIFANATRQAAKALKLAKGESA